MTNVDVLPVARAEFREAFRWYRQRSTRTGKRFAREVKAAIAAIRQDPQRHPRWDNVYRYCLLDKFPYYVAYRTTHDGIMIVAIRHGAQDQGAWQGR